MLAKDDVLYVADYWTGLHCFDLSDPAAPRLMNRLASR